MNCQLNLFQVVRTGLAGGGLLPQPRRFLDGVAEVALPSVHAGCEGLDTEIALLYEAGPRVALVREADDLPLEAGDAKLRRRLALLVLPASLAQLPHRLQQGLARLRRRA